MLLALRVDGEVVAAPPDRLPLRTTPRAGCQVLRASSHTPAEILPQVVFGCAGPARDSAPQSRSRSEVVHDAQSPDSKNRNAEDRPQRCRKSYALVPHDKSNG